MEPSKKYQPNIEPDIRPDLHVVKGGGESTPERGNLEVAKELDNSENTASSNRFGVIQGGGESTSGRGNLRSVNTEQSNLEAVKDAESSNNGYWAGKSEASSRKKQKLSLRENLKKKGPIGGLIAFIIGVPTIISILLSPALVIQQFTESLTKEFNDQLTSIDMRSTYLLKKKYTKTFTAGVCSPVTIRCKYQSIRENSGLAKRLNNAGVTIEGDKSVIPGRIKPTHFVYEGKRIPADQLLKEAKTNPGLRRALRKGYDPLYAAFSDRKSGDIRTRLGLKKSSSVSSNPDEMEDDLKKTASGTGDIPEDGQKLTAIEKRDSKGDVVIDENGNPVIDHYEDSYGNHYSVDEGNRINSLIDEIIGRNELADSIGKAATKSLLKGALTATAFGAGAADSACTVWNMVRIAGFAAKIYQQRQLIRYGYEFVKFAHKIKYGDATADESNFFLSKLTTNPNSEGKNALDSAGYRWAAYGDSFNPGDFTEATAGMKPGDDSTKYIDKLMLQNETSRYVNGQLVSSSLMAKIAGWILHSDSGTVDAADKACGFIKSWKGQAIVIGLAAIGAIAAIFSGGASISIGAAAQAAISVGLAVAVSIIQPKLIAMAKGDVIQGDENSNEVGNAAVSGMGGYNAETAQGRGLGVATQDTYAAYSQLSSQVAAKYAKDDRDSRSPFDPTSSNTFVGGILASFMPYTAKMNTVGTASLSLASFVSSSLSTLGMTQPTSAASDKYNKCDDPEYDKYNLAADPFCNLRYAIPVNDLEIDPETVLDYMLSAFHYEKDPVTGEWIMDEQDPTQKKKFYDWIESTSDPTPKGEYADFVKKCITRQNSIGDGLTDPSEGNGEECILGKGGANEEHNKMFRLFYIDTSVQDGLDEDFDAVNPDNSSGAKFRVATFNILHPSDNFPDCAVLCRLDRTTKTLKNNQIDIVGFQEMRGEQQKAFHDTKSQGYGADVYDTYPAKYTNGNADDENEETVVGWNKSKFELVSARQKGIKYFGNRKVNIVKLRYIENGANGPEFYVLNTHDPIDKRADSEGGPADRKYNNELYYDTIKNELTDAPVIMTGDFNSHMTVDASGNKPLGGLRENLAYCILTRNNLTIHVSDAQQGKSGDCPSEQDVLGGNRIDHIFISPSMKAANYTVLPDHQNGSDHSTVYSDVEIPGADNSGAGSTFVIGTYNQKRALSEAQHMGAVANIVDKGMDVVGTQETTNPKFDRYKSALSKSGYGSYPEQSGPNQTCSSAQAIFYNKEKFTFIKGSYFEIPRYPEPGVTCGPDEKTIASHSEPDLPKVWTHVPVIWLQDAKTGQTIIFINIHNAASVKLAAGTKSSKSRYEAAKIYVEKIKELQTENPGVPIFLTGDFNEGTNVRIAPNSTWQGKQENLLFCMFAANGLMKSAAGPKMVCDKSYGKGGVDYIYTPPNIAIEWVKEIASGGGNSGPPSYSDHNVVYAKVTVPGTGGDNGSGSSAGSDIVGDDYAKECGKYLSSGDCTGECVGFVKFRLVKHGVINPISLGNGGSVTATLRGLGFRVDTTPAVHSVMSLRHNSVGHTAMVSQVNKDGSFVVEEYNWPGGHHYETRTITALQLSEYRRQGIISFAHTEVKYK